MSLDIVILGPSGSPQWQLSIDLDQHHQLMQSVSARDSLLARLNDYYADAQFEGAELDALALEVTALRTCCATDKVLYPLLSNLLTFVDLAKREGRPILAVAD